ncbi:DUF1850 domain-containing protein [Frigidibacter sp. ROC022]|uniref:DUF1850 domain-containing protein n=1 Tax=Frigidibacter sp. ROC022 TaxID=2971796 RepID=UPI00215A413C|nr:DUF1850 domain-containing protein [Frigidibacter sp. ROC022]MCR8725704.1 DUF1850 domain-containing protein [Frigidibacter sp. ROC022]
MSSCLLIGATALALAQGSFSLSWEHSVEKIEWRETWEVLPEGLHLTQAAVKGSGAGMDPGEGAVLRDGWWVWTPDLAPVPQLVLAASGATRGGWTLCADGACRVIGAEAGAPLVLAPCPG